MKNHLQGPTTLIGSSFGGLTATWVAQQAPQHIRQLVLLAPAFNFLDQWLPRLGTEQLHQWKTSGWLSVYHYGRQTQQRLHYQFVTDAQSYADSQLNQPIPTLILHGKHDDIIDLAASQAYTDERPWTQLQSLDTDHGMADAMDEIWQAVKTFCDL